MKSRRTSCAGAAARKVAEFIDELVAEAKQIDPDCLCTFTNYPPTEFLRPQSLDFICFNVYLHNQQPFKNYLARLQMIADSKPLVLGEFGIDSLREGEPLKCEILSWQIETAFRSGLAGTVVFSYTDDWWRGGQQVEDWAMGLTTRDRQRKDSFRAVQKMFRLAPYFPLPRRPRISVVVASYKGARTLKACLDSLERLNYDDYEIILVDDGSTDDTPQIAAAHPKVRCFRHETNLGLSVARNTGIAAATGEIVAFTDADCRADEDWLYYLTGDLLDSKFAGIGGPNLLPPEDSSVAAAVLVSPGGPAHVMLTDREAEHIPGCNMAFYKWALDERGRVRPDFPAGGRRRGPVLAVAATPAQNRFQPGGICLALPALQRGGVLETAARLRRSRGAAGAEAPGIFQRLRRQRLARADLHGIQTRRGPARAHHLSRDFRQRGVPDAVCLASGGAAGDFQQPRISRAGDDAAAGVVLDLPLAVAAGGGEPRAFRWAFASRRESRRNCRRTSGVTGRGRWWRCCSFRSRLCAAGRVTRGNCSPPRNRRRETLDSVALRNSRHSLEEVRYWGDQSVDRMAFVTSILERLDKQGWPNKSDIGWSEYDLDVLGSRWAHVQITTMAEDYPKGKKMIHCRLRAKWSLQAKVAFWGALGFELLVIGFVGRWLPWLWLLLLTMPIFALFLAREKRTLQSLMVVFLDDVAKEWKLFKVPYDYGDPKPETPKSA